MYASKHSSARGKQSDTCSHIAGLGWRPALLLTLASHSYLALHLHPPSSCPDQKLVEKEGGIQEMNQGLGRVVLIGQCQGQIKILRGLSTASGEAGILFLRALFSSHR